MNFIRDDCQRFNKNGQGFKIEADTVTSYDYREIFLKNSQTYETDESTSVSLARTSQTSETKRSPFSSSGIKRKVDGKSTDDESKIETEVSVKRMKSNKTNENNSNSQIDGETSVEELLFNNDLILRIIFANLNFKDLKSCRQVTRLWYLEATKILLKHDYLTTIQFSGNAAAFQFQDAVVYKHPIPFQDFQTIIANSKLFPCNSFAINHNPLSIETVNLFRDHGHLVKSFCFDAIRIKYTDIRVAPTAYDVLKLAAEHFPNLRNITFAGYLRVPFCPLMETAIDLAPEMKNLNTLELQGELPAHIIALILRKAPSLKNIYSEFIFENRYYNCLSSMVKLGNVIPLLKNITLKLSLDSLRVYQQVLEQNPHFSKIDLLKIVDPDFDQYDTPQSDLSNMGRFLTAMLQQCSESVTEIKSLRCLGHIPELNFPVFSHAKHLGIGDIGMTRSPSDHSMAPLLPPGTNLAEKFPNVTSLELDIYSNYNTLLKPEEILSGAVKTPMVSVRRVSVVWGKSCVPDIYVERLCRLLPNVTSATFPLLSESSYEHIWKLSKLQELHVVIKAETELVPFAALDSAFTGFSIDDVKNLYEKDQADLNLEKEEIAALRIKPSIANLKNLKKLSLLVCEEGSGDGKKNAEVIFNAGDGDGKALLCVNGRIILSHVSKRFGFDLCPQLQSNVCVKFRHFTKLALEV